MIYPNLRNCTIAILGLGYVGLPLALEFEKRKRCNYSGVDLHRKVIGFDIKKSRIKELQNNFDRTGETIKEDLECTKNLFFTNNPYELTNSDVYIITVPTPVDENKEPNLEFLNNASLIVGKALKKRNVEITPIVIFESTVFPGATEEICAPLIEEISGLVYKKDFLCGYSPERINPGDKNKRIKDIVKITSGCDEVCAIWIDNLYKSIIDAGTYLAQSIKVAEAAKVIENTQRDLNIALVNELAIIFSKMNIDTLDVLNASSTKWNFLNFRPGLVGGHCIGVDPYYLTWKIEKEGYKPEMILSGRKVNEKMINFFLEKITDFMNSVNKNTKNSKMLVLGCSFKEDCPDIRNSKTIDFIIEAKNQGFLVDIFDPVADYSNLDESIKEDIVLKFPIEKKYDVLVISLAHKQFKEMSHNQFEKILTKKGFIFDTKGILDKKKNVLRL